MPSKTKLNGKPKTANYSQFRTRHWHYMRDLPLFSFSMVRWMLQDSTVRLGLGMREAAVCQAEFAYKDGQKWVPGIRASSTEVGEWVLSQLKSFWKFEVQKMATAQVWGWSGAEVTFKLQDGLWEIDRTLHRLAEDVRPLKRDGVLAGVRFKHIGGVGNVDLTFPNCYWHAYNPIAESNFGDPATRGCYSAWADKQLDGGAADVRRLFMTKDAYGGMSIAYPEEEAFIQGDQKPNRDIALEMVEQSKAGQVITKPSARDENGNLLWEIEYARTQANPAHILQYPKDLDVEILRGLEIADDVLTSEASGAWQGKQVPMQAFFTSMDRWLAQLIRTLDKQVLRPCAAINFGPDADYEIETKPLAEQAMEQAGAGEQDPNAEGQPARFSLDAEIGRGVVSAASLVTAARSILDRPKTEVTSDLKRHFLPSFTRFQSDCGAAGSNPAPGFQFGNTCWQLTGKHKEQLRKLSEQRKQREAEELAEERERVLQETIDDLGRALEEEERQELEREIEQQAAAIQKAEDRKFRRSKLFSDISETLQTDEIEVIRDFRGLMQDLHGMLSQSAEEYNDVFDELVDQIIGRDVRGRRNRGAFVRGLQRASDPTKVPKFDEVVQYVRDNPSAHAVLEANLGESTGVGDLEAMVFQGLRNGKREVPAFNSDATWNAALEYLEAVDPSGGSLEVQVGEAVPFSLENWRRDRLRRYWRLANAPAGGVTIGGKFFAGGQFIPKEVLAQATEEERAAIEGKQPDKPKRKTFEELMEDKTPDDEEAFRAAKADGFAIPPAWTEVTYHGKDENIIAEGRDAKGRKQRLENASFRANQILLKHQRIQNTIGAKMNELRDRLKQDAVAGNEEAKVLYLIAQTGFRIGGRGDGLADKEAFGASNLLGRHVTIQDDKAVFDFPGKKGVRQQHVVDDPVIVDMLRGVPSNDEPIFKTRDAKVRAAWKTYGGQKVHDIRNVVATETAATAIDKLIPPPPKTKKEFQTLQKQVAEVAAKKLGNRPSESLKTYINPAVFDRARVA